MPEPDESEPDEAPDAAGSGESGPDSGVQPLIAELRLLLQDATGLARSEIAYQTSRAKVVGAGVRNMALAAVFALIFVIFALGGLTVGLLLALTPLVTAWGATAIVVGMLLLGAGLCLIAGLGSWRRMKRLLVGEPKP